MTEPSYVIKGTWMNGSNPMVGYVKVNEKLSTEIQIVTQRTQATQINSKVLAQGWLLKAECDYPVYNFVVIQSS